MNILKSRLEKNYPEIFNKRFQKNLHIFIQISGGLRKKCKKYHQILLLLYFPQKSFENLHEKSESLHTFLYARKRIYSLYTAKFGSNWG